MKGELAMGKSGRKTNSKKRKNTSEMPASSNMILSPSKSGNLKIIKNEFNPMYNEGAILVEIPPCKRTIFFEKTSYFLSFPKVLFFMGYIKNRNQKYRVRFARMAFTKARKQTLMVPPLTNIIFYNLELCLAKKCDGTTLEEMASNQIANIFASKFNMDITDVFDFPREGAGKYSLNDFSTPRCRLCEHFDTWQKKTKANPNWVPKKFKEFDEKDNFYAWHQT